MPANMRKLMQEPPRPMEVISHDNQDQLPLGRKPVSSNVQRARTEAYLAGVVNGDIPLDDSSAEVIREYLDAHHARQ